MKFKIQEVMPTIKEMKNKKNIMSKEHQIIKLKAKEMKEIH